MTASFLEGYEDVAARVLRFWKTYPNGMIHTQIVEFSAEKGFILIQAQAFKDANDLQPSAIDYAFGSVASFKPNMQKWFVEDTSSSAIGRVLGLVLGNQNLEGEFKRPTRQNMEQVESFSAAQANAPHVNEDPWDNHSVEVPSYKTREEAEAAGVSTVGMAIEEVQGQLGGQIVNEPRTVCRHGQRKFVTKSDWGGYFCPEPKESKEKCDVMWAIIGSDGKWRPKREGE